MTDFLLAQIKDSQASYLYWVVVFMLSKMDTENGRQELRLHFIKLDHHKHVSNISIPRWDENDSVEKELRIISSLL